MSDANRSIYAAYNSRVYDYDKDFADDGRTKVLVIGNSFARDWVNILLESSIADNIDISYFSPTSEESVEEREARIEEAEHIFYSGGILLSYLGQLYDDGRMYIVGGKYFGKAMGSFIAAGAVKIIICRALK